MVQLFIAYDGVPQQEKKRCLLIFPLVSPNRRSREDLNWDSELRHPISSSSSAVEEDEWQQPSTDRAAAVDGQYTHDSGGSSAPRPQRINDPSAPRLQPSTGGSSRTSLNLSPDAADSPSNTGGQHRSPEESNSRDGRPLSETSVFARSPEAGSPSPKGANVASGASPPRSSISSAVFLDSGAGGHEEVGGQQPVNIAEAAGHEEQVNIAEAGGHPGNIMPPPKQNVVGSVAGGGNITANVVGGVDGGGGSIVLAEGQSGNIAASRQSNNVRVSIAEAGRPEEQVRFLPPHPTMVAHLHTIFLHIWRAPSRTTYLLQEYLMSQCEHVSVV